MRRAPDGRERHAVTAERLREQPPPGRLPRDYWQRRSAALDPEVDWAEIFGIAMEYEFPWDMEQALSLALFRTFAVPGIGELLAQTREFVDHAQKRYDDTAIVLQEAGDFVAGESDDRRGLRRLNAMHGAYDIPNDQMVYVLATFLVIPVRWIARYGYRDLTPAEVQSATTYWQAFGRHMGIRDIPTTFEEFSTYLDAYESERFGFSPGGRQVADATLSLMLSWYPAVLAPIVRRATYAMLDPHLRTALRYPSPQPWVERAVAAALTSRGRLLARWSGRRKRRRPADNPHIRLYPRGWDISAVGTFPERNA